MSNASEEGQGPSGTVETMVVVVVVVVVMMTIRRSPGMSILNIYIYIYI